MIVKKNPPISHQPYTVSDLPPDPKTGKALTATSMVTLPSGKKETAEQLATALDRVETKLNELGYSLKGNAATIEVQQMNYNKAKLEQEAKKKLPVAKLDAREQALLTSPKVLQEEYTKAVAAYKASSKTENATAPKADSKSTSKSESKATTSKSARLSPGIGGIEQVLSPVIITKSFDDSFGDTSIFAVDAKGSLTFTVRKAAQVSRVKRRPLPRSLEIPKACCWRPPMLRLPGPAI